MTDSPKKKTDDTSIESPPISGTIPEKQEVVVRLSDEAEEEVVHSIIRAYRGPLPDPDMLRGFEEVLPGAADRIIKMAEEESKHRHTISSRDLTQGFILNIVGQVFALLIALGGIGGGVYCISKGYQWSGGFLGGLPILGLVWVFVRTHAKSNDDSGSVPDDVGNPPELDKK